ncbi:Transcriptional regulatory protein resD [[Clostridium] ultunense Esp]|uniref:response regulator transcription factor n=1 Tax=Thermicanus aegyptius TaxID=94009 RepID=UPI0002B707B2|nr:response regulator transcription factor [Thermicanus aegyptius]CCQ96291.1 Transcriptional regulatory protein resD [[Clostridium] ultunense Esp]
MKICVIDDEPLIVEVLKAYLEREGYEVCSALNGREGLSLIEKEIPDFLILDLMLPDLSGEEICRIVREKSEIPILMLTAKTAEEERIQGLLLGADDYVTKPFSPREVVVRVQTILRRFHKGEVPRDLLSFEQGILTIDDHKKEVKVEGKEISLTPIEYKLLTGMARHPGRVFSRMDLLALVEVDPYEGYERNIDVHIKNLRKKVEKDPRRPRFIITVFGMGYKFGGKPDVPHAAQ